MQVTLVYYIKMLQVSIKRKLNLVINKKNKKNIGYNTINCLISLFIWHGASLALVINA